MPIANDHRRAPPLARDDLGRLARRRQTACDHAGSIEDVQQPNLDPGDGRVLVDAQFADAVSPFDAEARALRTAAGTVPLTNSADPANGSLSPPWLCP